MSEGTKKASRPRFPSRSTLLPTVVQDATTGVVLGLAYSNRESWGQLRQSQELILYSRSRKGLWRKGATSGNTAKVVGTRTDCDGDALLVRVVPRGPFCHTGSPSCFDHGPAPGDPPVASIIPELERLIEGRTRSAPPGSYTAALLGDEERRLKKVGEEATEVVVAAARNDREAVIRESADLLYHLLVVYSTLDIRWQDVEELLAARRRAERATPRKSSAPPRGRTSGRGASAPSAGLRGAGPSRPRAMRGQRAR